MNSFSLQRFEATHPGILSPPPPYTPLCYIYYSYIFRRNDTNAEIALRKILTANNVTEERNLGTLAYKMKCKWEDQVKKGELRLRGGQ